MFAVRIYPYLLKVLNTTHCTFEMIADSKFCIKARLLGVVKIVHNIMKANISNNNIIFPLLNLMKQLSKHRK